MIFSDQNNYNLWGEHDLGKIRQYKSYNFYHTLGPGDYAWIDLRTNFKFHNQGMRLNKLYYDIETYTKNIEKLKIPFDAENSYYPVNSIAVFHNISKVAYIFVWLQPDSFVDHKKSEEEILENIWSIYNEKCEEDDTYKVEDLKIELIICDSELELLKNFFQNNRNISPLFNMGFNNDAFDDPYVIKRLQKLSGDWENIVSEFGQVKQHGDLSFSFPDYTSADLQKLYKPVDSGGNAFGKSLPSFSLDSIAYEELGIKKLELDAGFVKAYEQMICHYLCYNLLDTILTYKIDDKLTFLEQIVSLARLNETTLSSSVQGRSLMYGLRNHLIYTKQGKIIRDNLHSKDFLFTVKPPKQGY